MFDVFYGNNSNYLFYEMIRILKKTEEKILITLIFILY